MEREPLHELTAAYALDALDEHDEHAYVEHLRRCPRCQAELAELQEAAGALAYATAAPPPPPQLRERILERARAERGVVVPFRRRWAVPALGAAAAAAACAAIGLGIWAASLESSLDETRAVLAANRSAAAILADPAARRTAVSGAEGSLVVAPNGRAVLALRGIRPAPEGKTYEAWVIRGQRPRPAGLFDGEGGRDVVVLQERVPRGAVVAVTVEDEGGVERPTERPRFTARA